MTAKSAMPYLAAPTLHQGMADIFIHDSGGVQAHYRARLPARFLAQAGLDVACSPSLAGLDHRVFVFSRVLKAGFLGVLEHVRRQGKKLVWELDDDLWGVPDWNPASRAIGQAELDVCDWVARAADAVVVSTAPLKEAVAARPGVDPDKVVVLPNLVDLDQWPEPPPRQPRDEVRVLWAGSVHHDMDLEEVAGPLERLLADLPRLRLYF